MKRFMIYVLIAVLLLLPCAVAGQSVILLDGLMSYWRLDEQSGIRYDAHGTWHLTDNNTVGYDAGRFNNAAKFVAVNSEYLSVSTGVLTLDDFAISTWVRLDASTGGNQIFFRHYGVGSTGWQIYADYSDKLRFSISGGSSILTGPILEIGEWYYVACWRDGGAFYMQVDGNSVADGTITGSIIITDTLYVGQNSAGSYFANATIDEAGYWNRALTASERSALYNNGAGLSYDQFSYYPLPSEIDQDHNVNELWSGNWFAGFGSIIVQIIGLALALVIAQRIIGLFWRVSWTL